VWYTTWFQKFLGKFDWSMIALVVLRMCWCFLSTIPFCWGVSTQDLCYRIPFVLYQSFNINSGPLWLLIYLIVMWNWVSTLKIKYLIKELVSDLLFMEKIQVCLDLSSTIVKKYLCPKRERIERGPHMSICTKSNIFSKTELLLLKDILFCLATRQVSQEKLILLHLIKRYICCIHFILSCERWSNLRCQMFVS
jgi:hypothetical protein